tara:strand:+ start:9515 stop:10165 length:651 start_codon:yes stop_codon:yes gene_type:complete
MANRTEELEKLVVSQALQLAELHRVAAETTSQPTLLKVAKLEIFNLTEEVRLLEQQVTDKIKVIESYKSECIKHGIESNELRHRIKKFQNAYDMVASEIQVRITEVASLTEENRQLKSDSVVVVDEEKKPRVVAILADSYEDFRYCQMLEKEDVRNRTTYARIGDLRQLENRKGYDSIVRSESWARVVRRDGRYNPNNIPDMKEFDAYLNKKTYGF